MKATDFNYPDSPQADLFQMLKEEQRNYLQPILRILKKRYQEELCIALLDYLVTGIPEPPYTHEIAILFHFVIERAKINPLISQPFTF